MDKSKSSMVGFDTGKAMSKGIVVCPIPVGELIITILFEIVDFYILVLLCVDDAGKQQQLVFDKAQDILKHVSTVEVAKVRK